MMGLNRKRQRFQKHFTKYPRENNQKNRDILKKMTKTGKNKRRRKAEKTKMLRKT